MAIKKEPKTLIEDVVEDSFINYSAFVLQRRSLPDVRDGMRYTQRQILHAAFRDKMTYDKKAVKSQKMVSSATNFSYCHGDTSAYGQIIRMGRPFVSQNLLIDIVGNYGTPIQGNDYAASRYTEAKLSELTTYIFNYINEDTLDSKDWSPTYDEEGFFPLVLPSVGYYNICNGLFGAISSTLVSSIPQFNIVEVNEELCKMIDNPDYEPEVLPDFSSGGVLLNPETTKRSLKKGDGKSALIRGEIKKEKNYIVVKSLPYGVYTNTICKELAAALDKDKAPFSDFKDLTQQEVDIRIYGENLNEIEQWVYSNTSVQKFFMIKLIMLDNGKTPKLFTLKEAFQAHLDHSSKVLKRHYDFVLNKLLRRQEIIDGLLRAYSILDEVITLIKKSSGRADSILNLIKSFSFTQIQAEAIVDLRLHKLSSLDIEALRRELEENKKECNEVQLLLDDKALFNNALKKHYKDIAKKFGKPRKTKIFDLDIFEAEEEGKAIVEPAFFSTKEGFYIIQSEVEQKIEPLDSAKRVVPEDNLIFVTSNNRAFLRSVSDLVYGRTEYVDELKLKDDEKVIFCDTVKNIEKHQMIKIEYEDKKETTVHNSFILIAASQRGRKIMRNGGVVRVTLQ